MPLKWSPGCKCCGDTPGCQAVAVSYTPSSQLSRGEWDGVPYWESVHPYQSEDRFLQQRVADGRICGWESPIEQQAGVSWDQAEENRYTLLSVVDLVDQVDEWEPFGPGWAALSQQQYEEAIAGGFLHQDCGFISRNNVLPSTDNNWSVAFSFLWPSKYDQKTSAYLLDGDGLTFGLYAAIQDAESFLDGVRVRYEFLEEGERPLLGNSLPGCAWSPPGAMAWNKRLFNGSTLLEETWSGLPNLRLIARTSQPMGGNIVDVVEVGAVPVTIPLFSDVPYAALLIIGDGEIFAGDDPNDPSQRRAVNDGDLVVQTFDQSAFDITDYYVIKKEDIVLEPILFGSGMRLYAPPDLPTGKKVAIYCSEVTNVDATQIGGGEGVGMKFTGAQTIKVRQIDEPTCRVIEPRSCPCPGDAEWYPVTIAEGLNKDYGVIDALLAEYVAGVSLGISDTVYKDELLGEFTYSMERHDLCSFSFIKLKAWNRVEFRAGTGSFNDTYYQVITFAYEDATLRLDSVFDRKSRVSVDIVAGLYNHSFVGSAGRIVSTNVVSVPQGQEPPQGGGGPFSNALFSQEDMEALYPCQFYGVRLGLYALNGQGYGTGRAYHYAASKARVDIPYEDFTCSDYVLTGTYDLDIIPGWWSPLRGPPPVSVILGMPWTITM